MLGLLCLGVIFIVMLWIVELIGLFLCCYFNVGVLILLCFLDEICE